MDMMQRYWILWKLRHLQINFNLELNLEDLQSSEFVENN